MACQVTLQGFNPFEGVREILEQHINALLEDAPSDSDAFGSFLANRNGVSGDLSICSSEGRFSARGWAQNMAQLERELIQEIEQQITSWRDGRFDKELPDTNFNGEVGWLGRSVH